MKMKERQAGKVLGMVVCGLLSMSAIAQEKKKTKIPLFVSHLSEENSALTRRKGAPNHFFITRLICFNKKCRSFVGWRNGQRSRRYDYKQYDEKISKQQPVLDTTNVFLDKPIKNMPLPKLIPKAPVIKSDSTITLSEVLFEVNSYRLKQELIPTLDSIANFLRKELKADVVVSGHTDNTGKEDNNLTLSSQRAEVVAEFLLDRGVDPERVDFMGMGSSQPVFPNTTTEGRRKNRRVEMLIRWKN
ncbi:MAG: OmpA family protein [Cyclobacteriaceae bacterium]|nr:OmpA family protein [Cyclobacteriaceae bacterium]